MKRDRDDATLRDNDGIIIYDSTDDYDESSNSEQDLFTQEYMLAFAREENARIARMKRRDCIVSISVILSIILYVLFLIWLIF